MPTSPTRLVNVPHPEYFEATSSWLSRLALSQGASLYELMDFFGLSSGLDLDRVLQGDRLAALRQICGLTENAFCVHERVVTSLNSMSPVGDNYLIRGQQNKPGFRYCPLCIKEMRTPHFPIHWRFIAWRWCSEHDCLLEDVCHKCGQEVLFPIDIESSTAGRMGYALLNRCQSCGASLGIAEPCVLQVGTFRRVSPLEDLILANGRGLLAALFHGWFQIKDQPGRQKLARFVDIERHGVLPVTQDWLSPNQVRQRKIGRTKSSQLQWSGNGFRDCDFPSSVKIRFSSLGYSSMPALKSLKSSCSNSFDGQA